MFFKFSLLISSMVLAVSLAACSSAEKREAEQKARAEEQAKAQQDAAIKAQKDAETKLFTQLKPEELRTLVQESVVYGFPLVVMDTTKQLLTNPNSPSTMKGELNQFNHLREFPHPGERAVVSPNVDTLYSSAWVDLSKEPLVLTVPAIGNRFYMMEILDAWTNVISSPGTRTTGTAAEEFALVGPNWDGQLPANVRRIQSPSNMVWIIGRTYTKGGKDLETVHAIQDRYRLIPLSQFDRNYASAKSNTAQPQPEEGAIAWKNSANEMVVAMDAKAFFTKLSRLMAENPPQAADGPMLAKLGKIGVGKGHTVDYDGLPADVRKSLDESVHSGYQRVRDLARNAPGRMINGWVFHENTGRYGIDYENRAGVAWFGLGANLPEDAIYPTAHVDANGSRLTGANKYVLHFSKGHIPPANGFWSLTMYDSKQELVVNKMNRYAISSRDKLKKNKDGSFSVYIQNANPGKAKAANWLPAPKGDFNVMMRLYWPKQAALSGEWQPPGIQKVHPPTRLTQRTAKRISKR